MSALPPTPEMRGDPRHFRDGPTGDMGGPLSLQLFRGLPRVVDEKLDQRAVCATFEGDDADWPADDRQLDRQDFDRRIFCAESRHGRRPHGEVGPARQKDTMHLERGRQDSALRRLQSARLESVRDNCAGRGIGQRQDPWLVDEISELDLSTPLPLALRAGD